MKPTPTPDLLEAELALQAAERYHRQQRTELSRRVLDSARRQLEQVTSVRGSSPRPLGR